MDYKTIMVSLALDRSNAACLAVAGDIAERFQARVVGIAASDLRPPLYFMEGDYAQKLIEQEGTAIRQRLSELETEFRTAVESRAKSVEWRCALSLPSSYVVREARAADLVVVGARSETIADLNSVADPNDLLMRAGRPLVIVPPSIQWLDLRSVLIAWKDAREARRAVFDALPILAAAQDVAVAEIPEQGVHRRHTLAHVEDVAKWLLAHGIVASTIVPEVAVPESEASVSEQLDQIAANVDAGVLIAGAYGHSRLREWILGGVTRHLATASRRCSFLSH